MITVDGIYRNEQEDVENQVKFYGNIESNSIRSEWQNAMGAR